MSILETGGKSTPSPDVSREQRIAETAAFLRFVFAPGDVFELRAFNCADKNGKTRTVSGYFDHEHIDACARAACALSAEGVFVTVNPVKPKVAARSSGTA